MKHSDIIPYILLGVIFLVAFKPGNTDKEAEVDTLRTITVTGSADMSVIPDNIEAVITFREYWTYPRKQKKKKDLEFVQDEITKRLKDAGVKEDQIHVSDVVNYNQHWYYWYWWYDYNRLHQKTLSVKLKSTDQMEEVVRSLKDESLQREAIVSIKLGKQTHSDIQEYRKLVKKRAIQAAEEKASYLLDAVGKKAGAVITITELEDHSKTTKTTHHGLIYPQHWVPGYGWIGGGHHTTTVNVGMNGAVSNASVAAPSGGAQSVGKTAEQQPGMKPIVLRYEIKAVFEIKS